MRDESPLEEENEVIELTEVRGPEADAGLPLPFDPLRMYLAELSKYPLLSRDEEFELSRLVFENKDRAAAQKLVISNLKLVVKIALGYYNTYLNVLDLIQEGNVGLLHAVKKYNPYKGTKFSTYASFWIRAYILKYIMDSWSMVKVGTTQGQRKLFYKLNKEKQKLEALGIYPAPKLLAASLDVKVEEVEEMQKRLALTDVSLDAPLGEGSDDTMMDVMRGDEDIDGMVGEREQSSIISKKVIEFKNKLNSKERFIFERRILAEEPVTLQEIGVKFQVSRERVRQIESAVLKKFKERFEREFSDLIR